MLIERAEADLIRAKVEVARLSAQLSAAESRVVKIEHYIEMARAYDSREPEDARPRNGGSPLVQASVEIIRERGTRQLTRVLVEELEQRGHRIGGNNKITNLSGALSRSPLLSASRTEGWGLKEWEQLEAARADFAGVVIEPLPQTEIDETEIPF